MPAGKLTRAARAAGVNLPNRNPAPGTPGAINAWLDSYEGVVPTELPTGVTAAEVCNAIRVGARARRTDRLRVLSGALRADRAQLQELFNAGFDAETFADGTGFRFQVESNIGRYLAAYHTCQQYGIGPAATLRLIGPRPERITKTLAERTAQILFSDPQAEHNGFALLPPDVVFPLADTPPAARKLFTWTVFDTRAVKKIAKNPMWSAAFLTVIATGRQLRTLQGQSNALEEIWANVKTHHPELAADPSIRNTAKLISAAALLEYGTIEEKCEWTAFSQGEFDMRRRPTEDEAVTVATEAFALGFYAMPNAAFALLWRFGKRSDQIKALRNLPGLVRAMVEHEAGEDTTTDDYPTITDFHFTGSASIVIEAAEAAFAGPWRDRLWEKVINGAAIARDPNLTLDTFTTRVTRRRQ